MKPGDKILPVKESAAFIDVDFPVSAGPIQTTIGHPEYSCIVELGC